MMFFIFTISKKMYVCYNLYIKFLSLLGGLFLRIKKTLLFFTVIILSCSVFFAGCDIKFVEKIEVATTTPIVEMPEENTNSSEPKPEESTTNPPTIPEETLSPDKITEVDGVEFAIENVTIYVRRDTSLYDSPSNDKTELGIVSKGEQLISYGVSLDGRFNMVKFNGGDYCYILSKEISYSFIAKETEPITIEPTESEKPTENPSNENSEPKNDPIVTDPPQQTPQKPIETPVQRPTQKPTPRPTQKPTQKPTTITGGIPYPANPSSTSVNFGVTFADVNIKVKVIKTAKLNSGPAKALNSNGYKTIQTFNVGTTLSCTGIGANGWIRIKLANGTIGYIDGKYLTKN